MTGRRLLLAYAALNAVLYSALLPLWEGFDEPFHFACVQQLANGQGLPDARTAQLSKEVAAALRIAPGSASVKNNLPGTVTYAEFFSWSAERREQARQALSEIPRDYRWQNSGARNYEAQHPPLAYLLLAGPERLLAGMPLPWRVLALRILAALAGSWLLLAGGGALCAELGLDEPYRSVALFAVLSSQMTWATLAHVDNDWLAVPLAVWTLVYTIRCAAAPTLANVVRVSLILAGGLLTKAYFLALEPLVLGICAVRAGGRRLLWHMAIVAVVAAPWYARNLWLYGAMTGMQESRAGIGVLTVLRGAPWLPWPRIALDSARSALWTGNNTFRAFSTMTLNLVLVACGAAFLLWAFSRHKTAERVAAAYCAAFVLALAYAGALAHISSSGVTSTPAPWYTQVVVTPLMALALLGAARGRRAGAVLAAAIALFFGYVLAVTYVFRLIPLYAGFEGRASLGAILPLYGARFGELSARLGATALGPAWMIFGLTAAVLVMVVALEVRMVSEIFSKSGTAL